MGCYVFPELSAFPAALTWEWRSINESKGYEIERMYIMRIEISKKMTLLKKNKRRNNLYAASRNFNRQ